MRSVREARQYNGRNHQDEADRVVQEKERTLTDSICTEQKCLKYIHLEEKSFIFG